VQLVQSIYREILIFFKENGLSEKQKEFIKGIFKEVEENNFINLFG
jgi:hypothetical protein